jgi:hypothetical protein
MTWYADLGPIDYFGEDEFPNLRAVGWLGEGHPYPQGEVSALFFERLCGLLLAPWQPGFFMGAHRCDLCPWEVPPGPDPGKGFTPEERRSRLAGVRKEEEPISVGDKFVEMGAANLWVPGEGCVYVAPSLIAHYIRVHRYVPPREFVDAVMRCPEMGSEEYRRALGASST